MMFEFAPLATDASGSLMPAALRIASESSVESVSTMGLRLFEFPQPTSATISTRVSAIAKNLFIFYLLSTDK